MFLITDQSGFLHRPGENAPQGHLLRGTSKKSGRLILWRETKRGPPNKASPPEETIAGIKEREYEPFDDGWPEYEEPFVTVH